MKRIVLIVGVVLLFISGVQGQKHSDSIFYKKIAGEYMFIQNEQAICYHQALFLMHESSGAMKFLDRSREQKVIGGGLNIIGGVMLAYIGWEFLVTNEKISAPVLLGGAFLYSIGAYLRFRAPINIRRAVDVYNTDISKESKKASIDFGLNPNGLGLSFKF